MMHQVKVENTSTIPLQTLIDSVADGGEIVFTKDDQPVAKLIPFGGPKTRPQFGSAKGMIVLADDFDEPLPDFEEYQ